MNSALQRVGTADGFPDGVVTTYVMNDAALPAEVFSNGYIPSADENSFFLSHAQANGYPDDQVWQKEWSDMQQGLPLVLCGLQPCIDFTNLNNWNNTLSSPSYTTIPKPQYFCRWRQQRPTGGLPDSAPPGNPNSTTCDEQRGPWRGFFQANLAHTKIVNTFNPGDGVLLQAWAREQKGLHGNKNFLSIASTLLSAIGLNEKADDSSTQYWASFPFVDGSQESLWSGGTHSNLIRQWGELAYWFPSLSHAAGTRDLSALGIVSQSFAAVAPAAPGLTDLSNITTSHTYLYDMPYSHVYSAFQTLVTDLK